MREILFHRFNASAAFLLVCLAAGCATHGPASVGEAQVRSVLDQWKAAYLAGDLAALMRLYPDDYRHQGLDRAGVERKIATHMKDYAPYDVRINTADATVTVKGDHATAVPVALAGNAGGRAARFELTRRGGRWWITGTEF